MSSEAASIANLKDSDSTNISDKNLSPWNIQHGAVSDSASSAMPDIIEIRSSKSSESSRSPPSLKIGNVVLMGPALKTFVSGAGFMSDAYDLFVIDVVKNVMSELYPQTVAEAAAVSTAALVGAVLGQLVFGALADKLGRRLIFMVTLVLVVIGSLGSATCYGGGAVNIYDQLAIWRFILGFGVGGEYPLSATITSEGAAAATRGYAIALVFSMQGVGKILAASINALCLSGGMPLDSAWRFALAFGSVPGLLTVYWRWQIEESHHFKAVVDADNNTQSVSNSSLSSPSSSTSLTSLEKNNTNSYNDEGQEQLQEHRDNPLNRGSLTLLSQSPTKLEPLTTTTPVSFIDTFLPPSSSPPPSLSIPGLPDALQTKTSSFRKTLLTIYEFRYVLLGTAGTWFLLDITFYGQGLFSGTVLSIAGISGGGSTGPKTNKQLLDLALGSLMLVCIAMPGYIVGTLTIERMGRRNMQLMGFSVCAILFLILGADYATIKNNKGLFVLLYGLTFFFSNFGANLTTFVVPAEAFPTRARATCHGISAASGKLGAVLGSSGMAPLLKIYGDDAASKDKGLQLVMYICCGVSLLGLIWTVLFTKETGKTNLEILDQRENNTSSVKKSSTSEDIERQRKMLLQG